MAGEPSDTNLAEISTESFRKDSSTQAGLVWLLQSPELVRQKMYQNIRCHQFFSGYISIANSALSSASSWSFNCIRLLLPLFFLAAISQCSPIRCCLSVRTIKNPLEWLCSVQFGAKKIDWAYWPVSMCEANRSCDTLYLPVPYGTSPKCYNVSIYFKIYFNGIRFQWSHIESDCP